MKIKSKRVAFIFFFVALAFVAQTLVTSSFADSSNKATAAKTGTAKKASGKTKSAKTPESKADDDQIHVSADALVSDRNANYAEFQGNVVTTQKGSVMVSDRLKIFYTQNPDKSSNSKDPNKQGAIDKIIATGHVKIEMEDKTGWADKAVYTKSDDSILLSGGNPRIFSGKSYLSGETIRINRKTQEIFVNRVSGDFDTGSGQTDGKPPKKRVEMNIFPNDPNLK